MAGWSYDRMLRHLIALNKTHGGRVLQNLSRGKHGKPRHGVTLETLQKITPEWFEEPNRLVQKMDNLEHRVQMLERGQEVVVERLSTIPPKS